jgi:long-chain acyl-CoA synthetase
MNTLPQLLNAVASGCPAKPAIVEGEKKLSYSSLHQKVCSLALRLSALGVKQGDPIVLFLPNGAEFVVSFFAIAELGGIAVPLNCHYQQDELTYFIDDCRAPALITLEPLKELCRRVLATTLPRRCELLVLDQTEVWSPPHEVSQEGQGELKIPVGDNHSDNKALYQFSSGSTGRPKRIARTHSNLMFELKSLQATLGLSSEDKFLGLTPFSHVNGLVRSMLASLSVGGTLFPLRDFKRQEVADVVQREQVTVFIGVPFMFNILAETNFRKRIDFSALRLCISSSAPMPVAVNKKFHEKYGFYVRQLYGSTETGTISVNMRDEPENTLDSVGLPIEGVEIAVFRDDGTPARENEAGEIAVKSPAAFAGYGGPASEPEPFRDGYFLTGDVGRIDQHGYVYLVGRKKFFINKAGYKINPFEIETLLEGHPKVKEVAVIGVATPYGEEIMKAVIVPREPCLEEEIVKFCRGRIADFKIPSLIEFCQNLPKTPTGKVLRKKL